MSSSENEQEDETLGSFFDKNYSNLLNFLPQKDVATMSILNQKWSQRVEAHKIWTDLVDSVNEKKTKKNIIKKILNEDIDCKPQTKLNKPVIQKQGQLKVQNQGTIKIDNSKTSKFEFRFFRLLILYRYIKLLHALL